MLISFHIPVNHGCHLQPVPFAMTIEFGILKFICIVNSKNINVTTYTADNVTTFS